MSVLSDFFIAESGTTPTYGEAIPDEDRCQTKSISPLEAAGMLAVLRGGGERLGFISEFKCLTPHEEEHWTFSIPQDMVDALARLGDDDFSTISAEFAEATAEELGWSQGDFEPLVSGLAKLARRALESKRTMFLWNSL